MINGKTVLAVIPARGGSKRLPRKNVLPLGGKPLIVWTLEAALRSKYIDKIIVSSNDDEILKISLEAGVEIIQRPQELATDESSTFSAVEHIINEVDGNYDFTILLQPTSPLRTSEHIDEAFELFIKKNADAIISVAKMDHSPLWSNTLPKDRSMVNFLKNEVLNKRSQDLPTYYRLNGAIYICNIKKLILEKSFFLKKNTYAYQMERNVSVDIDDIYDFCFAETLINNER